jgi:hypothetical protein
MSSHTYDIRDIPVLNDAVDLTALPALPQIDTALFEPLPVAGPPDTAALQAAIIEDVQKLAEALTAEAARDAGTLIAERVSAQLRAQLPGLVERLVREHLPGATDEPDAPHG